MKERRSVHNKLVRDRIPEIIRRQGQNPEIRILSESEMEYHLKFKLVEECHELFRAGSREEFLKESADILEILRSLAREEGFAWEEVESTAAERRRERGGFDDRVFLRFVGPPAAGPGEAAREVILPQLLSRDSELTLVELIKLELEDALALHIATAFCTRSMLNLFLDPFLSFAGRGGRLRLLTSVMDNFNDLDDLERFCRFVPGLELRVFYPAESGERRDFSVPPAPFHLKCFLFEKEGERHSLLIGSSNLTGGGLLHNYEWNYYSNSEVNLPLDRVRSPFRTALSEFDSYWSRDSISVSADLLEIYRPRWQRTRELRRQALEAVQELAESAVAPRPAQQDALEALAARRRAGAARSAVIAATGMGKTYLAAFDFRAGGFRNVLFVAHRESILLKAREVYRRVLGRQSFGCFLSGSAGADPLERALQPGTSLFAMVQSLSRREDLESFPGDFFDCLVIDEFHHSEARSYRRILERFRPRFLLGLTATPERMDGRDVLRHCDYDVAYEMRLFEAIEKRWLVPFQYFAIHDESDYSQLRWTGTGYDEEELDRLLMRDTRARLVVNNLKRFFPSAGKLKALAFCASRAHARFMDRAFNRLGLPSLCLLGEDPVEAREQAMRRLQSESDELAVICSVDVFGEGVDIPSVSHVLFLRPTHSFTVFLQQLGRGLRTVPEKEYLVALDFVGNFRQSYVAALALQGYHSVQEYLQAPARERARRPPAGCYVSPDVEVRRIWERELRSLLRVDRREALAQLYWELRQSVGRSPLVMDFFANPEVHDPYRLLKAFGGWLRAKEYAKDLTEQEAALLDTPAEEFLRHIEMELNQVRSYKMVVLTCLLETAAERSRWTAAELAGPFRQYYLDHPEHLFDYAELARSADPGGFPLSRVESLLRRMPLHHLSSREGSFFHFERESGLLRLKPAVVPYWSRAPFREMVADRVLFTLKRYFYLKEKRTGSKPGCARA